MTAYVPHRTAASSAKARNRAAGNRTIPAVNVVAVRPPGMKRATTIRYPPRSPSCRSAHVSARCERSPRKSLPRARTPSVRPSTYDVVSPMNAPAAAAAIVGATCSFPMPDATPAAIASDSLGTAGKTASSAAIPSTIAYAHGDVSRSKRNSNTREGYAARPRPLRVVVAAALAGVVADLVLHVDESEPPHLEAEVRERLLEPLRVDIDPRDVALDDAVALPLAAELVHADLLQQLGVRVVVRLPVDDLPPD